MSKKAILGLLCIATVLVVVGFIVNKTKERVGTSVPKESPPAVLVTENSTHATFTSDAYKFGMEFPRKYFLSAKEMDASTSPNLVALLLLDTQENHDILDGKITVPRDGATGITLNVHRNPKKLTPTDWAKNDQNWRVSDKKISTTTVSGIEGVVFRWSGLYEGATVIVTNADFAYAFAVSWTSPDDDILKDFDQILLSFRFAPIENMNNN